MPSSRRWLDEHFKDEYVKKAQAEGYVSRAAYKLLELNEKDRFLKPGMTVLDLGAAPGGWSQVARQAVGAKGRIVAVDLLEMSAVLQETKGVEIIQGDFTEQATLDRILELLNGEPLDLVISDMSPNISGIKSVDQPRSVYLVELALDCARRLLKPNGVFVAKAFQGDGTEMLIKNLRKAFKTVKFRKPKASRSRSSEVYLFARGLSE